VGVEEHHEKHDEERREDDPETELAIEVLLDVELIPSAEDASIERTLRVDVDRSLSPFEAALGAARRGGPFRERIERLGLATWADRDRGGGKARARRDARASCRPTLRARSCGCLDHRIHPET